MGIKHENIDVGAECDQFRESIGQYATCTTKDHHDDGNNITTIEYINGEGDPPFGKYRLTLEAIGLASVEDYANAQNVTKAQAAE